MSSLFDGPVYCKFDGGKHVSTSQSLFIRKFWQRFISADTSTSYWHKHTAKVICKMSRRGILIDASSLVVVIYTTVMTSIYVFLIYFIRALNVFHAILVAMKIKDYKSLYTSVYTLVNSVLQYKIFFNGGNLFL